MASFENSVYMIVVFFGWGLSTFINGLIGRELPLPNALCCNLFGAFLVNLYFISRGLTWTKNPLYLGAIAAGVLFVLADLCYYQLSKSGLPLSSLGPITSLYILVPIGLGTCILKERLNNKKLLGVLCAVSALFFLSGEEPE